MWIVKLGGSLCADARMPDWLTLLTQLGGGRVTVVCGGGSLADEVRRVQSRWHLDDLPAHNMAVLAMAQNAWLMQGLQPGLDLVSVEADIPRRLRKGRTVLWAPLELVRTAPDADTNWDSTSDSIALALAQRLNAEHLVVVKSCAVDPGDTVDQLVADGVLDRRFATLAPQAACPITVMGADDLPRMRAMLLGAVAA